jgi:hypothetical protein
MLARMAMSWHGFSMDPVEPTFFGRFHDGQSSLNSECLNFLHRRMEWTFSEHFPLAARRYHGGGT